MGYFPVRYDSRVVIYERKMFIRLATGHTGRAVAGRRRRTGYLSTVQTCLESFHVSIASTFRYLTFTTAYHLDQYLLPT